MPLCNKICRGARAARTADNAFAVDFGGGVFQPTAFGVVKASAEHHALNVIGQQRLYVAAHIVAIGLVRLRADVKRCDTFVAVWLQLCLDTLGLVFRLVERSATNGDR